MVTLVYLISTRWKRKGSPVQKQEEPGTNLILVLEDVKASLRTQIKNSDEDEVVENEGEDGKLGEISTSDESTHQIHTFQCPPIFNFLLFSLHCRSSDIHRTDVTFSNHRTKVHVITTDYTLYLIAPSAQYHVRDLPYDLWTTLLHFPFLVSSLLRQGSDGMGEHHVM